MATTAHGTTMTVCRRCCEPIELIDGVWEDELGEGCADMSTGEVHDDHVAGDQDDAPAADEAPAGQTPVEVDTQLAAAVRRTPMRTQPLTSQMTAVELAKVVAEQYGMTGRTGGRIYTAEGKPVTHGWAAFAKHLVTNGFIRVGRGINWTRIEWAGGPAASGYQAQARLAQAKG